RLRPVPRRTSRVAALDGGGHWLCRCAARHQAGIERRQRLGATGCAVGAVRYTTRRLHAAPRCGAVAAADHDALTAGGGVRCLLGVRGLEGAECGRAVLPSSFASVSLLGHLCVICSLRWGEMAAVAPFRYAGIVWAILLGFLLCGRSLPTPWSLGGISILL